MFERSILKDLRQWADNPYRKPLILRGARQVGKTTIVGQFSREFENYLPLNMEKQEARQLFESTDDVKQLLPMLFLYCNVQRSPGRTLIFIDEVQASPHAFPCFVNFTRKCLKYT